MMTRTSLKRNHEIDKAALHWKYVAPLLAYPKNNADYDLLVERLDYLLDIIGDNEKHPLMSLVDVLSNIVESYDKKNFEVSNLKGINTLKYLMELHGLRQTDLSAIGSQGVVSEILNGKRKLNVRQITILSKMFKVNPATFMDFK